MSVLNKLSQRENFDEDAFRKRILELRDQHSPIALVNTALDEIREELERDGKKALIGPMTLLANGFDRNLLKRETQYLMLLADQALDKPVDEARMQKKDRKLREHYTGFQETFVKPQKELFAVQEAEYEANITATPAIEEEANKHTSPVRKLFAMLMKEHLSDEQREDIIGLGVDEYMTTLHNAVKIAAREFGLGKGRQGGRA